MELRLEIYEYLIPHYSEILISDTPSKFLSIVLVCRRIYHEAHYFAFSSLAWHLRSPSLRLHVLRPESRAAIRCLFLTDYKSLAVHSWSPGLAGRDLTAVTHGDPKPSLELGLSVKERNLVLALIDGLPGMHTILMNVFGCHSFAYDVSFEDAVAVIAVGARDRKDVLTNKLYLKWKLKRTSFVTWVEDGTIRFRGKRIWPVERVKETRGNV